MNASSLHHLCPDVLWLRSRPPALFAQTRSRAPPATQQAPAPAQPAGPPKLAFTTEAGLLLVQIKGDQTAVFEELVAKLKAGAGKTEDATVKKQLASLEGLQVVGRRRAATRSTSSSFDPASRTPSTSCSQLLQKVMTPDELRAPETSELFKKAHGRLRGRLQQAQSDARQVAPVP